MATILFLLAFFIGTEGTKRCFDCTDVPHPADCKVTTFCPDSGICQKTSPGHRSVHVARRHTSTNKRGSRNKLDSLRTPIFGSPLDLQLFVVVTDGGGSGLTKGLVTEDTISQYLVNGRRDRDSGMKSCSTVLYWGQALQCMTRQFVSSGGQILYSSGCESKYRCSTLGKRLIEGRQKVVRADGDIVVCEECCDGDFCNINGCGVSTPMQPQRGPFCLSCRDEDDPINCRHMTQCELGETCSVSQIINHNADGIVRFQSGCIRDIQCAALALTAKTQNVCFECCSTDFCNDKCNSTTHHP